MPIKQDNLEYEILHGGSQNIIYKEESYDIVGACFEVHSHLGIGFSEIVYKDALCYKFGLRKIPFQREKKFGIMYKGILLPRNYICDFIVHEKIVLEIKAQPAIAGENVSQVINYLAVTKCKLGILINFGEEKLTYQRLLL